MEDLLKKRAVRSPDRPSIIAPEHLDRPLSFRALKKEVDEIGGRLRKGGLEKGDRVGIFMDSKPVTISLLFGVLQAGACPVLFHGGLPARSFRDHLQTVPCSIVISDPAHRSIAGSEDQDIPIRAVEPNSSGDRLSTLPRLEAGTIPRRGKRSRPGQLLMFTSGTGGDPKAVVLTGRNLLTSARASAYRLGHVPSDVWYDPLPLYHMGGLAPVIRSILYGSTVLLLSDHPGSWPGVLERFDVTGISLVPTMLRSGFEASSKPLPESVRFILLGGAPASRELLEEAEERGEPIYTTYGMTETASQVATADPEEVFDRPSTVGRPLLPTTVSVRDRDGRQVAPGETGQIVVSGPTVMEGYFDAPERNKRVFGRHGFRTGDYGVLDDSNRLYIDTQRSDELITGGENVDPAEVEQVIASHPSVRGVVVMGLDDEKWGQRVAALVEGQEAAGEVASDLRSYLEKHLAPHKIPKQLRVVRELPRTPKDTVDRARSRSILKGDEDRGM